MERTERIYEALEMKISVGSQECIVVGVDLVLEGN